MHFLLALILAGVAAPAVSASTYVEVEKICPVGGEKFKYMELMSYSTFGAMPDGMPFGSATFPIELPQCPGNGLVMYDDFDAARVAKLEPIVFGAEYQALRKTETPYFLAYRLAEQLGDSDSVPWLLQSATWEAKNADPQGERARRYTEAFVALVKSMPVDDTSFPSIALRARAANALRELGRFEEAEALRASIKVAPGAGGNSASAADNRKGWQSYLSDLAAPIARRDGSRQPIDMSSTLTAAYRCLEPESPPPGITPVPLTPFETEYCKRPEVAAEVTRFRKARAEIAPSRQ